MDPVDTQIDYLIALLNQKPKAVPSSQLLSNLAYYLPLIKKENQLIGLLISFIRGEKFISLNSSIEQINDFDDCYKIIEIFQYVFNKKILVSYPTISLIKFSNLVYSIILRFEKKYPVLINLVITGILSSKSLLNDYIIPEEIIFFKKFYKKNLILFLKNFNKVQSFDEYWNLKNFENIYKLKSLNLINLSIIYSIFENSNFNFLFNQLNSQRIPIFTLNLIYNSNLGFKNFDDLKNSNLINNNLQQGLFMFLNKPIIKNLNNLSNLINKSMTKITDLNVLNESLTIILKFSANCQDFFLVNNRKFKNELNLINNYWDLQKKVIFSTVLILKSFIDLSINCQSLNGNDLISFRMFSNTQKINYEKNQYQEFSLKILRILFNLNFIIDKLGDFKDFENIYLTMIEILVNTHGNNNFEKISDDFLSSIDFENLINDQIMKANFLFLLKYWQSIIEFFSLSYFNEKINPIINEFITKPYLTIDFSNNDNNDKLILENCHVIKLKAFKIPKLLTFNEDYISHYFNVLLHQFPKVLSSQQLIFAITKIGEILVEKNHILVKILETLIMKIKQESSILLSDEPSPTTRSTLIHGFIKLLPYLDENHNRLFKTYLMIIDELIEKSSLLKEIQYDEKILWDCITNDLDLEKSEVAIRWWYGRKISSKF